MLSLQMRKTLASYRKRIPSLLERTICIGHTVQNKHTNLRQYAPLKDNQMKYITNTMSSRYLTTTACKLGVNIRPHQSIPTRLAAEQLVRDMTEEERQKVMTVLQDLEQEHSLEKGGQQEEPPTFNHLWLLAFANSIPFIGFGFFDNAIMILAGEYIDYTVGATLGISTMAAAAIGNMISDVAGIGLAGWVETLAYRFGFDEPALTPAQISMTQSRVACHFGRAIGIVIGCIIGMAPLAFISSKDYCEKEHDKDEE